MRKRSLITILLGFILTVNLFLSACAGTSRALPASSTSSPLPTSTLISSPAAPGSLLPSIVDVVARVQPSVVVIDVEVTLDIFNMPFSQQGAGSGWMIRPDGYIVTNNHVVEGAQKVTVTLNDGRSFVASDIRTDPTTDLAVVKVDATNLPAAEVGNSSKLRVGEQVVAIGNALGQGISATTGIVSSLGVKAPASLGESLYDLIQTDAAINPGNSGGPLVNMAGQVIGINSIKISQVGVEGMGYAISVDSALPIIEQLIKTGRVVRPWMGVSVTTLTKSISATYNVGIDNGVLIAEVVANSPADRAGLKPGDVILAVNGKEAVNAERLVKTIGSFQIGQTIEVTYWRTNGERTTSVTLGEAPKQ